ncbi:hypothetical protein TSUD_146490 [Trifolium subterraneum]|uniref:Uncharacterized protein n=1 Tax=Trifolium subterraneum TaxID=3900 RepID=A0A2Z6MW29_TRISU|nr:hypothetical protein TSUD_146490 [Trifolium subterraneum]
MKVREKHVLGNIERSLQGLEHDGCLGSSSGKTKGKSTNTSFNIDFEERLKPARRSTLEQKKA